MRAWLVAGMLAAAGAAQAQDGARVVTLASVRSHRTEWAGSFIRVENVTVSGFSRAKGGLASDASGSVKLDDAGMPTGTIDYLERHCADAQPRSQCRGALEFTVSARDGRFTIDDAQFVPGE